MHLAEEDQFSSKAAQAEIKAAIAKKPNTTVYSYPAQIMPFLGMVGRTTTPAAPALAHERTYAFLNRQLQWLPDVTEEATGD